MEKLTKFGSSIWILDGDVVRMYGIPFSTRMTIVRLEAGGLWVHSPIFPSEGCLAAINKLGAVEHIVAPNKIHSLGIEPWKAIYPDARVWVSPEFKQRHPKTCADETLDNNAPSTWSAEIDQHMFEGSTFLDEVLFLHRPSRTLIVTDLIQKHDPDTQFWFWRFVKGAAGILGKEGGTARDLRASFRDRPAARRSLETVLSWDFDKLIISHGFCVHEGAKVGVEKAFSWLD